jgi:hypothetical protein
MAKYISNRQQNLRIGISSYTESQTVLEVTGKVGIGTSNAIYDLDVIGDVRINGGIYDGINNSPGSFLEVPVADGEGGWSWQPVTSAGAGNINGIDVRDEGVIVGTSGSITNLDFRGNNIIVSANTGGAIATITISENIVGSSLSIAGIATFANGPVLVGFGTSTGTSDQKFQVTGGSYISGDVGIGLTNPSSKLDVLGDGRFTGVITATTLTSQQLNVSGVATVGGNLLVNSGTLYVDATNNRVGINTLDPIQPFQIGAAGINGVVVTDIGSVGIGTTNPNAKLHVVGDINIDDGGTYSTTIQTQTPSANRVITYPDATGTLALVAGSSGQVTYNQSGINTGDTNFTYDATSGLTLARPLTVTSNLNATGISTITTLNSTNGTITNINSTGIGTIANVRSNAISNTGIATFANGPVLIGAASSTDTGSQRLQVTGGAYVSDDVGIGLTNPSSKLDVLGDGRFTGVITATTFLGQVNAGVGTITTLSSTNGNITNLTGTAGTITTLNSTNATITSLNINNINSTGIVTATQFSTGASGSAINITSDSIIGPSTIIIDPAAVGDNTGSVRIKGDLYVDGTEFIVNSTTIEFADFNVGIATTVGSNLLLDGAGIGIGSTSIKKTFTYDFANDALKSSENFNLASNKAYKIDGTEVLSSTQLTVSSINSNGIGTITTLDSTNGTITNLTGTAATITTLSSTNATLTNLTGTAGTITTLNSTNATLTNLTGTAGTITTLNSTTLTNTGIATFANGPVLIGAASSTDTGSQRLQVTGGAYVSDDVGIGTTRPTSKLTVSGNVLVSGVTTSTGGFSGNLTGNLNSSGVNTVTTLTGTSLNYTGIGTIATLNSTNGNITNLTGTAATITTLNSSNGTITNLTGTAATITTLSSTNATLTNLTGTAATITTLGSTNGTITNLTGTAATITTLSSTNGTITNLTGTAATITTLNSTTLTNTGIATFTNGPVVIGAATTTGIGTQSLQVTGGAYVLGDIGIAYTSYVSANISTIEIITNSTDQTVIDTFDKTLYRSAKYQIQMTNDSDYHAIELLVLHNDDTSGITTYASLFLAQSCGSFASSISGNDVQLLLTPSSTENTNIILMRTLIRNTGSVVGLIGDLSTSGGEIDLEEGSGTIDLNE